MGDNDPSIVRVVGLVLVNNPHDPTNELDVGGKRAIRAENRRDAERGVIESLAQHLDLDDAVKVVIAESANNALLFVRIEIRRDSGRAVAAFLVDRAHLPGMVDAACRGDDLMVRACALPLTVVETVFERRGLVCGAERLGAGAGIVA